MANEIMKKVAWFITAKQLIKFQNDDESYSVSDEVMTTSDFKANPIKKNNAVNVVIADGIVTSLKKIQGEEKKPVEEVKDTKQEEAPKKEVKEEVESTEKVTPATTGEERTETIYAVSGNKTVVKFSKDGDWIIVAVALQNKDYKEIGLVARNTVKVKFNDAGEIAFCVKVEEKKTEQKKTDTKSAKTNNYDPDVSIRQTAINSACVIVAQLVSGSSKPSSKDINEMKRAIAEDSLKFIQGK